MLVLACYIDLNGIENKTTIKYSYLIGGNKNGAKPTVKGSEWYQKMKIPNQH